AETLCLSAFRLLVCVFTGLHLNPSVTLEVATLPGLPEPVRPSGRALLSRVRFQDSPARRLAPFPSLHLLWPEATSGEVPALYHSSLHTLRSVLTVSGDFRRDFGAGPLFS